METNGGSALDVRDQAHKTEEQITENLVTLMHRSGLKAYQIATAIGVSPQTIGRRLKVCDWPFWEVEALARFFDLSLDEMTGELPAREARNWTVSVRHQGLEPRTRCFGASGYGSKRGDLRVAPNLRIVA